MTVKRVCIVCGRIAETGGRCALHPKIKVSRHRAYRNLCAIIIANATACAICGQPPQAEDPFVVDHIWPRARGGTDHPGNLQAAHRSCNGHKSATLPTGGYPR